MVFDFCVIRFFLKHIEHMQKSVPRIFGATLCMAAAIFFLIADYSIVKSVAWLIMLYSATPYWSNCYQSARLPLSPFLMRILSFVSVFLLQTALLAVALVWYRFTPFICVVSLLLTFLLSATLLPRETISWKPPTLRPLQKERWGSLSHTALSKGNLALFFTTLLLGVTTIVYLALSASTQTIQSQRQHLPYIILWCIFFTTLKMLWAEF